MEKDKVNKNKGIGQKLARLRKKKNISIEELSEKTGLLVEHLKRIEAGERFAPVGDILKISRVLSVDPDLLLPSSDKEEKELKKRREADFRRREASYLYDVLTPKARNKHLRAFRVSIPARSEHPRVSYQHEGEEFVYVLSGEVEIKVGQKKFHLKKDESLHFSSEIKHSLKNPGNRKTVLIVTIYTP